jgi:hypothetical protein
VGWRRAWPTGGCWRRRNCNPPFPRHIQAGPPPRTCSTPKFKLAPPHAGPVVDSARANLAATFVNAFVNAGFGQDKLVTKRAEKDSPDEEVRKLRCGAWF